MLSALSQLLDIISTGLTEIIYFFKVSFNTLLMILGFFGSALEFLWYFLGGSMALPGVVGLAFYGVITGLLIRLVIDIFL